MKTICTSSECVGVRGQVLHVTTTCYYYYYYYYILGWWRGVVGNAFRWKRSYSTPGPVSTAMGDCLRAGKPSWCEACQLGRLSLLLSVGR